MTTFQVLYNVSTHWPIPSYNPFCQIQYVSPYFNADIDGAHNFPVEQGHNVLPIGEPFYKCFSQQFGSDRAKDRGVSQMHFSVI